MTVLGKKLGIALTMLTIVSVAACSTDNSNPTNPNAPGTTAPVILSLSPSTMTAASTTQVLTVNGTGFAAGNSLILKGPDTGATLYGPSAISDQTSTSFKATVTVSAAGNWTATVRLSDGTTESSQFAFTVAAPPAGTNPQISSVGPGALVNSSEVQTITIAGVNFRSGLSLIVRNALGVSTTYNGASITAQTATSFSAQVLLPTAGAYQLTVRNSDGLESGLFSLIVNATPIVTAVGPSTLVASTSTQTIDVTGLAFGSGLSYVLNGPGTGATLHGPSDVTNLTPTSFKGVGVFPVAGNWTITVINASGVQSAQFSFRVGP